VSRRPRPPALPGGSWPLHTASHLREHLEWMRLCGRSDATIAVPGWAWRMAVAVEALPGPGAAGAGAQLVRVAGGAR